MNQIFPVLQWDQWNNSRMNTLEIQWFLLLINVQLTFLLFVSSIFSIKGWQCSSVIEYCPVYQDPGLWKEMSRHSWEVFFYWKILCSVNRGEHCINTQNLIILSMSLYYICFIRVTKLMRNVWLDCLIKNPINVIPYIRYLTLVLLWAQFKFHQLQFCPFKRICDDNSFTGK